MRNPDEIFENLIGIFVSHRRAWELHQHLCPQRNIISVTFDDYAIGKTEKNASLLTVYGVVVDIDSVSDIRGYFAVDDGFLIA